MSKGGPVFLLINMRKPHPEHEPINAIDIECEVVDGQHQIRNLLPLARDVTIQDDPDQQLKHCLEHDTKAFNELIATTFEAHRKCKTYDTQFKAAELIMNLLTKRREMLLQPTKLEPKRQREGLPYGLTDQSSNVKGISGIN